MLQLNQFTKLYFASLHLRSGSMRIPVFWDTSALVPLCVRQGITPRAIALYKLHDAVVWWATPAEIASTLARILRMKQLDASDWTRTRKLTKRYLVLTHDSPANVSWAVAFLFSFV